MIRYTSEIVSLGLQTLQAWPEMWHHRRKVIQCFYDMANASLLMSCVLSLFIGGVLALQSGPVLVERGLSFVVGQLVGLSMCKELAPVMMAILMAGRIGSAITAELGSMKVYQEIDALWTMKINPIHYLVLPRVAAIPCALPLLVLFSILVGWMGGGLVSWLNQEIGLSLQTYFSHLKAGISLQDLAQGITKSIFFAMLIGIVSCHHGLQTKGGPRSIGRSVTQSVVQSIVCILISDYAITRIFVWIE